MNSALLRSAVPAAAPTPPRGQAGTPSGARASGGASAFASIMQGTLDARGGAASRGARHEPATDAAPDRSADHTADRTSSPASPARHPQPDAGKTNASKPSHRGGVAAAPTPSTIAPASLGAPAPDFAPVPVATGTDTPSEEAGSRDSSGDSGLAFPAIVPATVVTATPTAADLVLFAQSRPAGTTSDDTASDTGSDSAGSHNTGADPAAGVGASAALPVGNAVTSAATAAATAAVVGSGPALRTAAVPPSTAAPAESTETTGVDAAAGSTGARTIDATETATGVGTAAPGTAPGTPSGTEPQHASPAAPGTAPTAPGATALAGLIPATAAFGVAVAGATARFRTGTEAAAPVDEAAAAPATVVVPAGAVVTPAPAATPATPATAPAPAAPAPAAPLAAQVARPLFSLAGAVNGDHVLTISVSPDNLGPVTVRAHVNGDNIRVELFAPTDLARDALRAILPDLRRDLSGGGLNAHLDLSAHDSPSDPSANRQDRPQPEARTERGRGADDSIPHQFRAPVFGSTHTIDILA